MFRLKGKHVFVLLGALLCLRLPTAAGPPETEALINDLQVETDHRERGVQGLLFRMILSAPEEERTAAAAEGRRMKPFDIRLNLYDRDGHPVRLRPDATEYTRPKGGLLLMERVEFEQNSPSKEVTLFLPYFALYLPVGQAELRIEALFTRPESGQVLDRQSDIPITYENPPVRLFKVKTDYLRVRKTDANNETWDYRLLNEREVLPDLVWAVYRGGWPLYESPRRSDHTVYTGAADEHSGYFTLSEGDRISLVVQDHDRFSMSDRIGNYQMDPWLPGFPFGQEMMLAFGAVDTAKVRVESFDSPELRIGRLTWNPVRESSGVSGWELQFDYQCPDFGPDQPYYLDLGLAVGDERVHPVLMHCLDGKSRIGPMGRIIVPGGKGSLRLFMPHYGLPAGSEEGQPWLMETGVALGQRVFDAGKLQLSSPALPRIQDTDLNDFQVRKVRRDGVAGLEIRFQYDIPHAYYDDLPEAWFYLRPGIYVAGKPLDYRHLQVETAGFDSLHKGRIRIPRDKARGEMGFFVPFHRLPGKNGSETDFRLACAAEMEDDGRALVLGSNSYQRGFLFPDVLSVSLKVTEARVKPGYWKPGSPEMHWQIYLGKDLIHRSDSGQGDIHSVWPDAEPVKLRISQEDIITVELLHHGSSGNDEVLGKWEGRITDVQQSLKGGMIRMKVEGLKKLVLKLSIPEN